SGNMLKANYVAGRGIKITGNTITSDEELDLTFHFPLIKTGTVVRLDMSGIDPITVNDLTGKITLAIDNTLQVLAGKLSVVPKQLKGSDGILFDGDTVHLLFDLKDFKLSPEEELQLNLSNQFTSSSTEGLKLNVDGTSIVSDATTGKLSAKNTQQVTTPLTKDTNNVIGLKYDGSTLKNDATLGLAGNYQAKSGSGIDILGNIIGEHITALSGCKRVGNDIQGAYTGQGMIYVSGSSIGICEADLDQKIADKTGISQPSSGGGGSGGGNPFSDLSKGLSNFGSILGGQGWVLFSEEWQEAFRAEPLEGQLD
ncbi:hypothetical protein HK104_005951, partial [Borealophlyctis nickersoniae]